MVEQSKQPQMAVAEAIDLLQTFRGADLTQTIYETHKAKYLYVLGTAHAEKFLNGGRAMSSVLSRNETLRKKFTEKFGDSYSTVRDYCLPRKESVVIRMFHHLYRGRLRLLKLLRLKRSEPVQFCDPSKSHKLLFMKDMLVGAVGSNPDPKLGRFRSELTLFIWGLLAFPRQAAFLGHIHTPELRLRIVWVNLLMIPRDYSSCTSSLARICGSMNLA